MLLKWTLVGWKIVALNYNCHESSFVIGSSKMYFFFFFFFFFVLDGSTVHCGRSPP